MTKVSVLGVYNGAFTSGSHESILKQTFRDFEFVIVDDGSKNSTDSDTVCWAGFVVLIRNEQNIGLEQSLNKGLMLTEEYVARQDADDVSLPARLQLQTHFLFPSGNWCTRNCREH